MSIGLTPGLEGFDGLWDPAIGEGELDEGLFVGLDEGLFVGLSEGLFDGISVGLFDGIIEGLFDGKGVGVVEDSVLNISSKDKSGLVSSFENPPGLGVDEAPAWLFTFISTKHRKGLEVHKI